MLIGTIIRHYKAYKGINYVPISHGHNFSAFIGSNGVGKSSVLEALDQFFNYNDVRDWYNWNVNKEAKLEGGIKDSKAPYIAPVFLLKKDQLPQATALEKKIYQLCEKLSDVFWTKKPGGVKELKAFFDHRDRFETNYKDDYFLLIIGKKHDTPKKVFFSSYHNLLLKEIDEFQDNEIKLQEHSKGLTEYIQSLFSYIYIPVEVDMTSYTRLATEGIQKLLNKDIQKEIENIVGGATALKRINDSLKTYLDNIQSALNGYEYKGTWKNELKIHDLTSKIVEAYFSIKVLHKQGSGNTLIPIDDLSSGEKQKALIDLVHSFLCAGNRDVNTILAIDEPEHSLNVNACYDQFEKLKELSDKGIQVIVTTHWYGFLPIISEGLALSVLQEDEGINVSPFDLYNYRERIRQDREKIKGPLPYDISLKSYNDLVQSIVSSLSNGYNWLLCEGLSEKIYFSHYFQDEIKNKRLRVLPLGGIGEVIKLHKFLSVPMQDKDLDIKGKVICLIDTDEQMEDYKPQLGIRNLVFKRLLFSSDQNDITLSEINHNVKSPPTEIEKALEPIAFYETLKQYQGSDATIKKLLQENPYNKDARCSFNCLNLRQTDLSLLNNFFQTPGRKGDFASNYIGYINTKNVSIPAWISEIKSMIE